ncbi:MAG: hypothetical protein HRT47_10345 [Candidatus Caenarcaniphilales bacterium]|nr:hypothetical protein [Candidatus Caenarcaniphilales bacterium]
MQREINEIVNSINEVSTNTKVIVGEDANDGNIMDGFFGAQGGIPFSPSVGITYQTGTNDDNSINIDFTTANADTGVNVSPWNNTPFPGWGGINSGSGISGNELSQLVIPGAMYSQANAQAQFALSLLP